MFFTICICTRNRAAELRRVLLSLSSQWPKATELGIEGEVLVIDNASSDDTRSVVEGAASVLPLVRYIREDRVGIAAARNRGLAESDGEWVIWLDDDVLLSEGWLAAYLDILPTVDVGACGPVMALWPDQRPFWIPDPESPPFPSVTLHFHPDAGATKIGHGGGYPPTANLALRRDFATAVGGFDEGLGHIGGRRAGGEDVRMIHEITQRFGPIDYDARLSVQHPVTPDRMTLRVTIRQLFWGGLVRSRAEPADPREPTWFGAPRWVFGRSVRGFGRSVLALVTMDPTSAIREGCYAVHYAAYAIGAVRDNARSDAGGSL